MTTATQAISISSERFRIRTLLASDVDDRFVSWWNDAELQKGFNEAPRGWDRDQTLAYMYPPNDAGAIWLGLFEPHPESIIGFFTISLDQKNGVAYTSILVGEKAWWGKGVVIEVRNRLFPYMFGDLGVRKVVSQIYGRNFSSIYNCRAQGYTLEAVEREYTLTPEGQRADCYHFGLLKREWEARQKELDQ